MTDFVKLMKELDEEAKVKTTDPKVFVACALGILDENNNFEEVSRGVNCNYSFNERLIGKTYRQMMFNSTDTKYRPWDKIIHAEENAIYNTFKNCKEGDSLFYNTAIVTRYPCEKCAQLLIFKGVKKVFYGRDTEISEATALMFREAGVDVVHVTDYKVDEVKGAEELKKSINRHKLFIELHNLK